MHEVLVNRLEGLSLPRKSVVRLTDRPDMTLDVYRGRKTTKQQQTTTLSCLSTSYTWLLYRFWVCEIAFYFMLCLITFSTKIVRSYLAEIGRGPLANETTMVCYSILLNNLYGNICSEKISLF